MCIKINKNIFIKKITLDDTWGEKNIYANKLLIHIFFAIIKKHLNTLD